MKMNDRVNEREVEAVAIAIQRELNGDRTVYSQDRWCREMAEAAIRALDSVRGDVWRRAAQDELNAP